VIWVLARKS